MAPDSGKMKIIITCHTELGNPVGRKVVFNDSLARIHDGIEDTLEIIEDYDSKICFALTPKVVDGVKQRTLNKIVNKEQEIGLHLHSDDSFLVKSGVSKGGSPALRDFSYKEQKKMIVFGKNLLEKKFELSPVTFIAGKWSENNDTIRALTDSGFTHDCTPNPGFISENCDWGRLPRISLPYHPSKESYQKKGPLPILLMPISKVITNAPMSPEVAPTVGLGFLKACFEEYYIQQLPIFHMTFHSPCMASEYYQKVLDQLLAFISEHENIMFIFPSQIKKQDLSIKPKTKIPPYVKRINKDIIRYILKLR